MSDMPVSADVFLNVFVRYNETIWPAQILLNAIALIVIALAFRKSSRARSAIWIVLGFLWAWSGLVYHAVYFAPVNPAAYVFAALFTLQAMLLAAASRQHETIIEFRGDGKGVVGLCIIAYALVAYPIVGSLVGHQYPAVPTFGAPCPITIFTLGMLLWARGPRRTSVLVIPTAWAFIATLAIIRFGMPEDLGLPIAAFITLAATFAGTSESGRLARA